MHVMEQFIDNQRLTLQNEATELRLREKQLELNAKQAEKIIDVQADLVKNQEKEKRKTATRYAYIGSGVLAIIFGFILYCLQLGKEDFVLKFIQIIGYLLTTLGGYYFGRKSKSEVAKREIKFDEAEIIS